MQRLVLTGPLVRVMTCGDSARARWVPWLPADDTPRHDRPDLPARADVDPVLAEVPAGGRLAVAGDDAALAAVLVRLLRRERLDVAVALLPAPDSAAAAAWGVPTDPPPRSPWPATASRARRRWSATTTAASSPDATRPGRSTARSTATSTSSRVATPRAWSSSRTPGAA